MSRPPRIGENTHEGSGPARMTRGLRGAMLVPFGTTGDHSERGHVMKLLLAYDGFDHSQPALEETARIAHEEGAEVTVLSVVPPDARGSKSGGHVGLAPPRPHAGARGGP